MITVLSYSPVRHGEGYTASPYVIFADAKSEVPETGTATAAEITGFTDKLPVGTLIQTGDWQRAWLLSDDTWSWEE